VVSSKKSYTESRGGLYSDSLGDWPAYIVYRAVVAETDEESFVLVVIATTGLGDGSGLSLVGGLETPRKKIPVVF